MWIQRRMLKISCTEHKTDDEVQELTEEQRTLITTLGQRQRKIVLCRSPVAVARSSSGGVAICYVLYFLFYG